MKMNKLISLLLSLVLALSLVACGTKAASSEAVSSEEVIGGADAATDIVVTDDVQENAEDADAAAVSFTFTVVDAEGNTEEFQLGTEKGASLGDALFQAGLIEEEEYKAGFVTIVNGLEANWDENEAWWNLQDAEGNSTPVGIADIIPEEGDVYSFVYTIGF